MGRGLWYNEKFIEVLSVWGYPLSEKGFVKCIREQLNNFTLNELARRLNITSTTIRIRMREHGIKNPHKPGGANNPGGIYGKSCKRRDIDDGIKWKGGD